MQEQEEANSNYFESDEFIETCKTIASFLKSGLKKFCFARSNRKFFITAVTMEEFNHGPWIYPDALIVIRKDRKIITVEEARKLLGDSGLQNKNLVTEVLKQYDMLI